MKLSSIVNFLSPLALITVIMGLIYVAVQQCYRMGANDPQIQMAQDISYQLSRGRSADAYFEGDSLDISRSPGLFVALYNSAGQPVKSTGLLNEKMPQLPSGVFDFTKQHGEDRISWQPHAGVRVALVIDKIPSVAGGFVAAGRSLKEVEARINNLNLMVLMGWLICAGILILRAWIQYQIK